MKPNSLQVYYRLTIRDKDGKIIKRTRLRKSRSYVIGFLGILRAQNYDLQLVQVVDITGATRTVPKISFSFNIEAAGGNAGFGMVVGTGTNAESNADYKLQTAIAHGTGGGQLSYGAQSIDDPAEVGANVDMVLTRVFSNGSGGSITVNEIGLYGGGYGSGYYFCMIRDKLASGEPVANGEALTVEYTLRTTA